MSCHSMKSAFQRFCYFGSLLCCCLCLCLSFGLLPASAVSLTTEVTIVQSSNGISQWAPNGSPFLAAFQDIPRDVSTLWLRYSHGGIVAPRSLNDYVSTTYDFLSNGTCQSTDMVDWFNSNSTYSLVSAEITGQQSYNNTYCLTSVHVVHHVDKYSSGDLVIPVSIHHNTSYWHQMIVTGFTVYRPTSIAGAQNQVDILNAIREQTAQDLLYYKTLDASINRIEQLLKNGAISVDIDKSGLATDSAIIDAANQAHKDSLAQQEALKEQNKQQQDQYDKDKQEEADRENSNNDSADEAKGLFAFSVSNPFLGLFKLFSSSECVSIPIIAGMVGAESSTYCAWFSPSVRNTLTPVLGISSMILLFGYVISWLRSDDTIRLDGKGK